MVKAIESELYKISKNENYDEDVYCVEIKEKDKVIKMKLNNREGIKLCGLYGKATTEQLHQEYRNICDQIITFKCFNDKKRHTALELIRHELNARKLNEK